MLSTLAGLDQTRQVSFSSWLYCPSSGALASPVQFHLPASANRPEPKLGWKKKLLRAELSCFCPALYLDGRLLGSARGEVC